MTLLEKRALAEGLERELALETENISHFVFEHPELGLEERVCADYLAEYAKKHGFEVEMPFCGFDTAFRASFGERGPTIAFLAEYDALPGYGEKKLPGHACGHNWIAAACAGAAAVLAEYIKKTGVQARVLLFGTPAEETYCCKVKMARNGAFDGVDVALQPHLAEKTSTCCAALAMNTVAFTYTGRPAHSATAPWDGVNALDAVQLFYAGVNALRQHVRPNVRMHGIVTDGGEAPNIVPGRAQCVFSVRSSTREYLDTILPKVYNIAKGASLMTGAALESELAELPMDNLVNLPVLQRLAADNLARFGMKNEVTLEEAQEAAGSTDVGNVSHVCPTMYMEIGIPGKCIMVHEESALGLVDSPEAMALLHDIVNVMTGMSVELIDSPSLIAEAHRELEAAKHIR